MSTLDGDWHETPDETPDGPPLVMQPFQPAHREPPRLLRAVAAYGQVVVDPATLWAGALATMLIAGLISIVGVLTTRALPGVEIISSQGGGSYTEVSAVNLTVAAVAATLAAALLAHVLLLLIPRPLLFFASITLLTTAMVTVWPFTTEVALPSKAATALVYLAIGGSITGLLAMVSRHVCR